MLLLGLTLLTPSESAPARIDPLDVDDLAGATARLRKRVAEVRVEVDVPDDMPLMAESTTAYCIPWSDDRLACLAQLLNRSKAIRVLGPDGAMPAKKEFVDGERRVTILKTERPLPTIGLVVSEPLAPEAREMDASVFALVSTAPGATTLSGIITDPGVRPEHEGMPTTTLELQRGMPVFDTRLRWVGFARSLGWDESRDLLIPPELVRAAIEARTIEREEPGRARPWWAKDLDTSTTPSR